jgi:hypothetical protein
LLDKLFISLKAAILTAELTSPKPEPVDWVSIEGLPSNAELKDADGTLRLSLVNIEEERILKNQVNTRRDPGNPSRMLIVNPEIKLNVYVQASAYFTSYTEALKRLAYVIRVFQKKNVYSAADVDTLLAGQNDAPPILDQIIVDLYSQSLDQQYQFSQSYGSKQIPSVIYKVRLLVIDELPVEPPTVPVITTIGLAVNKI